MFESNIANSAQNAYESGLDGSDLELEFLSTSSCMAPFEPKRCSTPLSVSSQTTSWNDYGGREMENTSRKRFDQRHCVPSLEGELSDGNDRGVSETLRGIPSGVSGNYGRQQHYYRRLPMASSSSPSLIRARHISNRALDIQDYNMSATPSPTFSFGPPRPVNTVHAASPIPMQQGMMGNNVMHHVDHLSACAGVGRCGCSGSNGSPILAEQYARVANFRGGHKTAHAKDNRWTDGNFGDRHVQSNRLASSTGEPTVVWSGILPARVPKGSAYSCKVFLGGVPWDITEGNLLAAFGRFGQLKVEWPSNYHENPGRNSKGYLYIIFDNERSVRALLSQCTVDSSPSGGGRNYYYKVCSSRLRRKDVQVIPWPLSDSTYVHSGCISTSGTKTVFVGSLHGMLNAEGLARIMNDLFGGVVTANIDTDKHKYPIGSGRVVFNCTQSYVKAIRAAFVEVRTQKFSKKIQIDPFLEDSVCSVCANQMGPFFCRDMECFNYYCGTCWQWQHSMDHLKQHSPMMRNPRSHDDY